MLPPQEPGSEFRSGEEVEGGPFQQTWVFLGQCCGAAPLKDSPCLSVPSVFISPAGFNVGNNKNFFCQNVFLPFCS